MAEQTVTPSMTTSLMARVKKNPPAWIVAGIAVVLLVMIAFYGGASQIVNTVVTGGMWALLAVGLALILGVMNIPHFAHGESFMVGTFVGYFVFSGLSDYLKKNPNEFLAMVAPFVGFLVAALVGLIMGAAIERLVFAPLRHRNRSGWVMNTFLLTVGLSFIMTNGATLTVGPNFRGIPRYWDVAPLEILGARVAVDRLVTFGLAIITLALFWFFLQRTRIGRAIRAVSQDETGAQIVGIDLDFIHTLTFSLATAMAAMSGASLLFLFQAYPTVGLKPLYFAWYVVMLVGLGNVAGAIIGGFLVALFQTATQQFIGIAWEDVLPTFVMILVLLLAPSGIFGSEVRGIQEQ
ncbi:MAG: branched-chain amino acid ABC transporter permease [Chloroflexota bacterium]